MLAEVPERIHCARLLPDRRTHPVRVGNADARRGRRHGDPRAPPVAAWSPPRTRRGAPTSRLTASACSTRATRADGRAFAFLSQHPDGRDGVAVVQTAEPSMASEPTWLADGETFSFDIDAKHMGVFSTGGGRMNVLPDVTTRSFITMFRYVVGTASSSGRISTPARRRSSGSRAAAQRGGAVPRRQPGARSAAGGAGSCSSRSATSGRGVDIIEVDVAARTARADRAHPRADAALSDARSQMGWRSSASGRRRTLVAQRPNGAIVNLTKNGHVWDGNRCGRDLIVSRRAGAGADRHRAPGRVRQAHRTTERRAAPTGRRPARLTARSGSTGRTLPQPEHPALRSARLPRAFPGLRASGSRRRPTASAWRS